MAATGTKNDWAHTWLRIREWARVWKTMKKLAADTTVANQFYAALESGVLNDGCVLDPDVDQGEKIGILGQRALVAGMFANPRGFLDPLMLQLSRAMGSPQTNPLAVLPILYDYMAKNTGSFNTAPLVSSRQFTRGSWTAGGSNVGTGTVLRLAVDRYGNPLESDQPDVLTFTCAADKNSGTNPGQEQFSVQGLPFRDQISRFYATNSIGVGNQIPSGNMVGVTCDATKSLIANPSFADFSGTGASSSFALSGWTLSAGTAASMSVDTTNYYRSSNIETTPGALKCTGSVTLTQKIPVGQLNAFLAYMNQIAWNRQVYAGSGTLQMTIGSQTWSVSISAQTGWNLLRPTLDKNLYFANFANQAVQTQVPVTITLTVSGGGILIDDFVMQPFQSIAGKLVWAIGGATPWVVNDTGTLTDTVALTASSYPTNGDVQTLISEAYGYSVPCYTGADPTAPTAPNATVTTGGTGAKGVFGVVVTFLTSGVESAPSPEASFVLDGTNDRFSLTSIQAGPGGTTARIIYITLTNDYNKTASGPFSSPHSPQSAYYRHTVIADNVTTTASALDPNNATTPIPFCGDI